MQYASGGDLHNYLREKFTELTWNKKKLAILWQISEGYMFYINVFIAFISNLLINFFILGLKLFIMQNLYIVIFIVEIYYLIYQIVEKQDINGKLEI